MAKQPRSNGCRAKRRFGEKLATPDTTIADLIGEVDPIKVAEGRYLSDELTISYGLIPRTNRGIFNLNELPDLAERIQVGLLNMIEERDVQIRGYKIRLPLDVSSWLRQTRRTTPIAAASSRRSRIDTDPRFAPTIRKRSISKSKSTSRNRRIRKRRESTSSCRSS